MEGLSVSKLEEGQQWGKNTSSKDKVHWGRRPPFIGGGKSNRYVLSPHTSGTTAPRAVLPLRQMKQGKGATKHEPWGGSTAGDSGTTTGFSGTTAPFGGTAAQNEGERERGKRAVLPRRKGGTAAKERYCRTTAAARYRTIRDRIRPLESTR